MSGRVRGTDKFGQAFEVIGCRPNRKNDAFNVGYAEIKGTLYRFEVSTSNKEGVSYWIRVTKVNKNKNVKSSL